MSDLNCPYCDENISVCHDDGYEDTEDLRHEQKCPKCTKLFLFRTYIKINYESSVAECLNTGSHLWFLSTTYTRCRTRWLCQTCDATKALSNHEMAAFLKTNQTQPVPTKETI